MFEDTLAPAIGLAANQATPWSNVYGTLGFLVPMASIISRASPSRAEFLWLLGTNVLGSCVSAAVTALALFYVIKARQQSEGPIVNSGDAPSNAVASTVAAIWSIIEIYIASAIRYNYPQTTWMISACLIFSNYGMIYAVQFPDMTAAWTFLQEMLLAHLVGFAISAGVSLVMFPTHNSRERFFKTASECTREIRLALRTNIALMEHNVSHPDSHALPQLDDVRKHHKSKLDSLQTKMIVQLKNAQNEIARGTINPADLGDLTHLLEEIIVPLIGLCRVPDVMKRTLRVDDGDEKDRTPPLAQYGRLVSSIIGPFSQASAAANEDLRCSETTIGLVDGSPCSVNDTDSDKDTPIQQLQCEMGMLVDCKGRAARLDRGTTGFAKFQKKTSDAARLDEAQGSCLLVRPVDQKTFGCPIKPVQYSSKTETPLPCFLL